MIFFKKHIVNLQMSFLQDVMKCYHRMKIHWGELKIQTSLLALETHELPVRDWKNIWRR